MEEKLTLKEAYEAMYIYLEKIYDNFKYDALGAILGDMRLLKDDEPIDKAVWEDWLEAVKKVRKSSS